LRCACGIEKQVRVRDVVAGGSRSCRSCSAAERMNALPENTRIAKAKKASAAAAEAAVKRKEAKRAPYGHKAYASVYTRMAGAKRRCTSPADIGYENYGGRGIEFRFASIEQATIWVLDNLGPAPKGKSIDRVDNDRHYEPGNLRWATRLEQARNKRAYKKTVYGRRLAELRLKRPDLTYETLRTWVQRGMTDDEIVNRRKHTHDGACVRHIKLRSAQKV